ncbi:flagellar protein FlaG [Oxalobacter sp. OttesenSCG-928-P03]|nr:flagellar protein FlaG [Oxalobacter sp. OttesenSCG-928-P03]
MEIRTIGSASVGTRPAVDSGVVPQATQNKASEQTAVQTVKAVPQVAEMEQMGAMRKSAGKADPVQQQPRDSAQLAGSDVSARLISSQEKADAQKTRQAENRTAARQAEDAGRMAQAERARQERMTPVEEAAEKEAEKERTQQVVNELSESLASMATSLDFSVDEDLGRVVVKIVDSETQEVIKQIPSEEALALAKSLGKMTGMFVQTRA